MRRPMVVLSLCLCLLLAGGAPVRTWAGLAPPTCPGDVNGDGTVDLFDLVAITMVYDPGRVASGQRADVNGDGVVNLFDLILVTASLGTSYRLAPTPAQAIVYTSTATATPRPSTQAVTTVRALSYATATPRVYMPIPCCKYCSKGKACGNSCIARNETCHKAPGCACDR